MDDGRWRFSWFPEIADGAFCAGEWEDHRKPDHERSLDAHCLAMITAGRGWHVVGGQRTAIGQGDLIAVVAGERHGYGPDPGTAWSQRFLLLRGGMAGALVASGLFAFPSLRVARGVPVGLRDGFAALVRRHLRAGDVQPRIFMADVHGWLARVASCAAVRPDPPWLADAYRRLGGALDRALALPDLARDLGVPYDRFRREFLAASGISPGRLRMLRRLTLAQRLLAGSDAPIALVARRCGFADATQFGRHFRAAHGCTPNAWRRRG